MKAKNNVNIKMIDYINNDVINDDIKNTSVFTSNLENVYEGPFDLLDSGP